MTKAKNRQTRRVAFALPELIHAAGVLIDGYRMERKRYVAQKLGFFEEDVIFLVCFVKASSMLSRQ